MSQCQDLLSELECPICTNFILPPILQCETGHSYCSTCFAKLKNCPQCFAPKTKSRCFTLEHVVQKLTFPCKFKDDGCQVLARGSQIKDHERVCEFVGRRCPLRFNNDCPWTGPFREMRKHCTGSHPTNIYFENRQDLVSSGFGVDYINRFYVILFMVYDELFRCTWDLNNESGIMRFSVYNLRKPQIEDRFWYRVSFYDESSNLEMFSLQGPVEYLANDSQRFFDANYMIANYDFVKEFCNENGDLHYVVQIYDNNILSRMFRLHL